MSRIEKARYWTGVLYPDNMLENWEDKISHLIQLPYAYCIHSIDKDTKSEHRKDHVHLIVAHNNTTTYKHALSIFNLLSSPGRKAINTCEAVIDIRHMYDYLIHDTDDCRKKGKELYSSEFRVIGNNFDIGSYEQLGIAEKNDIFIKLSQAIVTENIMNYSDFYEWVILYGESVSWLEVMRTYSGHFERLTKARYQKYLMINLHSEQSEQHSEQPDQHSEQPDQHSEQPDQHSEQPDQHSEQPDQHSEQPDQHSEQPAIFCPICGSVSYKKNGKTLANTQKFKCKDCGKIFSNYSISSCYYDQEEM